MEEKMCRLNELAPGQRGRIQRVASAEDMKQRLLNMGFTHGAHVECVYRSPLGDPTAYFIKGTLVAVREEDAGRIWIIRE